MNKYNIIDKNGQPITNFKDLFSENNLDNSSDNAYNEIADTIDGNIINNSSNIQKLKEIEDSIISLKNNSSIYSYNKNSALNNGKLFEI